jgi:NAD(P)-dependent dehydrogenase (short-subunit alcohol dehydrogenase family)
MVRSVVVTGVAHPGQLGDTVARAFAIAGDRVSIVARSIDDASARAGEMRADGLDAHPFACDLADPAATLQLAGEIRASAGHVHVLVNVAGGFAMSGPVAESDPAVWTRQLAINLGTAYATTRAFLPSLRETRGSVVFVASATALPGARLRNTSAYAVAKGGVVTLMRAVAQEELGNGVRANAVAPGTVRTRENAAALPGDTRYVEPASVASAILFLCSDRAAQVTGQVIELTP